MSETVDRARRRRVAPAQFHPGDAYLPAGGVRTSWQCAAHGGAILSGVREYA